MCDCLVSHNAAASKCTTTCWSPCTPAQQPHPRFWGTSAPPPPEPPPPAQLPQPQLSQPPPPPPSPPHLLPQMRDCRVGKRVKMHDEFSLRSSQLLKPSKSHFLQVQRAAFNTENGERVSAAAATTFSCASAIRHGIHPHHEPTHHLGNIDTRSPAQLTVCAKTVERARSSRQGKAQTDRQVSQQTNSQTNKHKHRHTQHRH